MSTSQGLSKISNLNLAGWILLNYGIMIHIKLHKLAFYVESYHLAYTGEPLTDGEYEAWVHGPINRQIYDGYKVQASLYGKIAYTGGSKNGQLEGLTSTQKEIMKDVVDNFISWTNLQLETTIQGESPWQSARVGYPPEQHCTVTINKTLMGAFYKKQLNDLTGIDSER